MYVCISRMSSVGPTVFFGGLSGFLDCDGQNAISSCQQPASELARELPVEADFPAGHPIPRFQQTSKVIPVGTSLG